MPVNKIIYGSTTLIDLSSDTVTVDKLAEGTTAHDKTGAQIVGTMTDAYKNIFDAKTNNGVNFSYFFYDTDNITNCPVMDTSRGTNFSQMFNSCSLLREVTTLDTSSGTNLGGMFGWCPQLSTVAIDTTSCVASYSLSYTFNNCTALQNVTITGPIRISFDIHWATQLTQESIRSILYACISNSSTSSRTLTLPTTAQNIINNSQEFTSMISVMTSASHNWSIAYA